MGGLAVQAFGHHALITTAEADEDLAAQADQIKVADFLRDHTTGPILLNLVGNERAAYPVLDRVIYEGTKIGQKNAWTRALSSPASVDAHIVLMRSGGSRGPDDIYTALHNKPAMAAYHVVFHTDAYTVYQLGT